MSAVELSSRDEIESGDEESHPAGDEDGVAESMVKGRQGVEQGGEKCVDEVECDGLAESYEEEESEGNGDEGSKVACDRAVDTHIDEGVAVWNASADEDDGPGGSAEGGSRQDEGQGRVDAVVPASEVVPELVSEQDAKQSDSERPSLEELLRVLEQPWPWPEVRVLGKGGEAEAEVFHEARADGECGENTEQEQEKRKTHVLPGKDLGAHQMQRCRPHRSGPFGVRHNLVVQKQRSSAARRRVGK